ncbi:MAG TPA: pilus assembly protein TadG-related protein [Archangium sp.]|uniref:pilus assembly protein TadG-related protein n=1 Tax=Archangium sp. TaxID=1872627 RepID=UPI002ED9A1DA
MKRRGQTLVVFALTLLLLVLMVTMTLSIGMKAREKIELQTVADAAAYSNAGATARTFNSISIMNRAFVGNMVAMAGVESLISWSSYYRASLHGVSQAYNLPLAYYAAIVLAQCPVAGPQCVCATQAVADITEAKNKFEKLDQDIAKKWDALDRKAGKEALGLQIGSISDEQNALYTQLEKDLLEAQLASSIVKEANKGGRFGEDLVALSTEAFKTVVRQEVAGGENCGSQGAACTRRDAGHKLHFVYAAMGSRGYSFVTGRGGAANFVFDKLKGEMPERDTLDIYTNTGSGYFPPEGAKTHSKTVDATEAWADDHGTIALTFNRGMAPCTPSFKGLSAPEAHVRSTHMADTGDQHQWTGGQDSEAPEDVHTMGVCTLCPGMWPAHMDYNYKNVAESGNNWGQPKLYSVIQRDYNRPEMHPDPWNLMFRFRFSPSSDGVTFDNRGIQLTNGLDISKATALSAGIAYYKRAGPYWREPPNFLNPFWRATLVSAQVDLQGRDDIENVLKESAPFSADVYKALSDKGYSAW